MDSIGTLWVTFAKPGMGAPPTRCVGLSGVSSSGCFFSRSVSSWSSLSKSRSEISVRGFDVVQVVVVVELFTEFGGAFGRSGGGFGHGRNLGVGWSWYAGIVP